MTSQRFPLHRLVATLGFVTMVHLTSGIELSNDLPEHPTQFKDRSLIPLLVPDPQLLSRDQLIASRHRPIGNRTEFQHDEDIMAETRRGLRKMLVDQRKREHNLNYLFMHKDRLDSPTFEKNLVSKMKKMKSRVHHLLDLEHDVKGKSRNN